MTQASAGGSVPQNPENRALPVSELVARLRAIDAASFIPSSRPAKRRSPLTADGRARIVAAQRARWDKAKQKSRFESRADYASAGIFHWAAARNFRASATFVFIMSKQIATKV